MLFIEFELQILLFFFLWKLETLICFQLIQNWNDCGQNGTISQHWVYARFYVINSKCRLNEINWKQNCAKTKQEIKALNGFVGRFWPFAWWIISIGILYATESKKKNGEKKKYKQFIYQNTVYVNYKYASQNSEHHLHLHWPLELNLIWSTKLTTLKGKQG